RRDRLPAHRHPALVPGLPGRVRPAGQYRDGPLPGRLRPPVRRQRPARPPETARTARPADLGGPDGKLAKPGRLSNQRLPVAERLAARPRVPADLAVPARAPGRRPGRLRSPPTRPGFRRNAEEDEWTAEGEESVSSSVLNVTFDCSDAASVAQFWSEVTGWPYSKQQMPGGTFWVVGVPASWPAAEFAEGLLTPQCRDPAHLPASIGTYSHR